MKTFLAQLFPFLAGLAIGAAVVLSLFTRYSVAVVNETRGPYSKPIAIRSDRLTGHIERIELAPGPFLHPAQAIP